MLQVFDIRAPLPRPGLSPVCVCVRACAHTWRVGALCLLVGGTVSVQALYLMFPVTQLEAVPWRVRPGGSTWPLRPGLWACRFRRASEDADSPLTHFRLADFSSHRRGSSDVLKPTCIQDKEPAGLSVSSGGGWLCLPAR